MNLTVRSKVKNYMKQDEKEKKRRRIYVDVGLTEKVNRYGQANEEYVKAYTGYEWENKRTGQHGTAKGHKQVAQSKVNPKYKEQNYKQQAGFNAEIDIVAKTNANNIIQGKSTRVRRSNDVGRGNDTQVDIGAINRQGDYIIEADGSVHRGVQIKFSGKTMTPEDIQRTAKLNVNRMRPHGRWAKYKCDIGVPSEQYGPMWQYAQQQSAYARQQAAKYRSQGDVDKAKKYEQTASEYEDCYRRIKDSGVTSEEAMFARKHPILHTAKRIGETSHAAGIEQASSSAMISGVLSATRGALAIIRGEKTYKEVAGDIAVDSAKGAVHGYGMTVTGAALKGIMSASPDKVVQGIARTNAPALFVSGITGTAKSFSRYLHGKINALELAEEIGENGVGLVASTWGSALGTLVLPGIGTVAGGLVGSIASSIIYQGAMKTLREERASERRREKIVKWAAEAKLCMEQENRALARQAHTLHLQRAEAFSTGLCLLQKSESNKDINAYLQGMKYILGAFDVSADFRSEKELDDFMRNPNKKLIF